PGDGAVASRPEVDVAAGGIGAVDRRVDVDRAGDREVAVAPGDAAERVVAAVDDDRAAAAVRETAGRLHRARHRHVAERVELDRAALLAAFGVAVAVGGEIAGDD